jgi:hypothetical protein
MTQLRFLLISLKMTQWSRWRDDIDQPRRQVIDESGNKPATGQGGVRASAQQYRPPPLREDQ